MKFELIHPLEDLAARYGMTVMDFTDKVGLSRSMSYAIRGGYRKPGPDVLGKLQAYTGLGLDDLATIEESSSD